MSADMSCHRVFGVSPTPHQHRRATVRRLSRFTQVLAVVMLLLCSTAAAAQTTLAGLTIVGVDREGPDLVTLLAAARPPSQPGTDDELSLSDFGVVEDGQVRSAETQRVLADQLEVALLLDITQELEPQVQAAIRSAAVEFLLQLPDTARVAVIGSGGAPVAGELTAPGTAIVQVGEVAEGSQSMVRDAVTTAAALEPEDDENRRVVVALSAGPGATSGQSVQAAADDLASAGAVFYGVALTETGGDRAVLNGLAQAAGGEVLVAAEAEDLVSVYDRIARDLSNLYEVAYQPAAAGTATVTLAVESPVLRAEATRSVPARPGTAASADVAGAGSTSDPAQETAPDPAAADAPDAAAQATTPPLGGGALAPTLTAIGVLLAAVALAGAGLGLRRRQRPSANPSSGPAIRAAARRRTARKPIDTQTAMPVVRKEAERRWTEERKRATASRRAGSVVALAPARTIRLPEARRPNRVIRLPEPSQSLAPELGPPVPRTAGPRTLQLPTPDPRFDAAVYQQPLHDALVGHLVTRVWGIGPRFAEAAGTFSGQRVTAVQARGPHLLVTFSGGDLVLHTQLGPGADWAVYPAGAPWQRPRRLARATIETATAAAVCFSPRVCELLRVDQVRSDPVLAASLRGR